MPDPFHPDLTRAERQPVALVTPGKLPFMRVAIRLLGAMMGLGVERVWGTTGQRIWVYRHQRDGKRPAVLWIHGGGLIFGSPITEHSFCREMRDSLGVTVASPIYRFAPEHPYPAALEDIFAALVWLASQPGVDPDRIAIGGDSAGGGLAAALALFARDQGGPKIAFQLLHEPMLDDRTRLRTDIDAQDLRIWSPATNHWAWESYLSGLDPENVPATAAPARVADTTGLPPAFLGIGTRDLFHDEAVAYAENLRKSGVPVTLQIVPGAYHGFAALERKAQVSVDYRAAMIAALGAALAPDDAQKPT